MCTEKGGNEDVPSASPAGFMAKIAEMMNCSFMFENIAEMPEDLAGMLPASSKTNDSVH